MWDKSTAGDCNARAPSYLRRWGRRVWLVALLCGFVALLVKPASSETGPRLVVYLHTSIKARALQSALAQALPGTEVIVLGRHRDFIRELANGPDAVLALKPVLEFHGLSTDLQGARGGRDTEPYVLLSVGSSVSRQRFASMRLGAVDLLGRQATGDFIAGLLGLPGPPPTKYVVKTEDLLPLLQFRAADVVIVSERAAEGIKRLSELDLRVTPLESRVGLAAVSIRTSAGTRVIKPRLLALDLETKRKLQVEEWR